MPSRRGFGIWLALAAGLVLAGIALPYGVLSGVWTVPLFWLGFGAAVAVLIAVGTRGWRDGQ